jgi:tetratricopeptide (TPR) repeat protein
MPVQGRRTPLRLLPAALAGLATALLLVLSPPAAWADLREDLRQCREEPDARLAYAACSRALADPQLAGRARAQLHHNRGVALSEAGRHGAAIADFTRAIDLWPEYHTAWNQRGRAHRTLRDYDAAIADFGEAHRLKPDHRRYLSNRGLAFKLKGDYRRALADYDAALRLDPDDDVILHNRGVLHRDLKNYAAAVADLERSLALDPGDTSTMVALGRAYAAQGRHAEAIRYYDRTIERRPGYGVAWLQRGLSHLAVATSRTDAGAAELAVRDLRKAEALGIRGRQLRSALEAAGRLAPVEEARVSGPPSPEKAAPPSVTGDAVTVEDAAAEAGEIVGSVTARRAGAVQVALEPHPGTAPQVGDRVEFSAWIEDIEVDAGEGTVRETGEGSVWVDITRGRPNLGMEARIHATGRAAVPAVPPPPPRPEPRPEPVVPDRVDEFERRAMIHHVRAFLELLKEETEATARTAPASNPRNQVRQSLVPTVERNLHALEQDGRHPASMPPGPPPPGMSPERAEAIRLEIFAELLEGIAARSAGRLVPAGLRPDTPPDHLLAAFLRPGDGRLPPEMRFSSDWSLPYGGFSSQIQGILLHVPPQERANLRPAETELTRAWNGMDRAFNRFRIAQGEGSSMEEAAGDLNAALHWFSQAARILAADARRMWHER